jgi:hypothetical protein
MTVADVRGVRTKNRTLETEGCGTQLRKRQNPKEWGSRKGEGLIWSCGAEDRGSGGGFFGALAVVFDAERCRGLPLNCGAPIRKVMSVEYDAKEIPGKEAILRGLDTDDTNDQAI